MQKQFWMLEKQKTLSEVSKLLKTKEEDLVSKIEQWLKENHETEQKLKRFKEIMTGEKTKGLLLTIRDQKLDSFNILATLVEAESMDELRSIGDTIKKEVPSFVAILAANPQPDKIFILGLASDDAVKSGVHVGELVKVLAQETGGNGGGKPNMAQAGGKNPAKLRDGLEKTLDKLREQLKLDKK